VGVKYGGIEKVLSAGRLIWAAFQPSLESAPGALATGSVNFHFDRSRIWAGTGAAEATAATAAAPEPAAVGGAVV
jgi:hypothetical protein